MRSLNRWELIEIIHFQRSFRTHQPVLENEQRGWCFGERLLPALLLFLQTGGQIDRRSSGQ